jgi:hypothetical protein
LNFRPFILPSGTAIALKRKIGAPMRTPALIILSLFLSVSAWSKVDFLKLLKENKQQYNLSRECKEFIQSSTHKTFSMPELQQRSKKLSELFMEDYYFHYTKSPEVSEILKSTIKDRKLAHKEILDDGGYAKMLEFQMLNTKALMNMSGVGWYVAANHKSSDGYGHIRVTLTLSPDANYIKPLDLEGVQEKSVGLQYCPSSIIQTLLLLENNVDVIFFEESKQWFNLVNDDIILESKVVNTRELGREMDDADSSLLLTNSPLINGIFRRSHEITSAEKVIAEADKIKTWDAYRKRWFVNVIAASLEEKDMLEVMDYLEKTNILRSSDYEKAALNEASFSFLKLQLQTKNKIDALNIIAKRLRFGASRNGFNLSDWSEFFKAAVESNQVNLFILHFDNSETIPFEDVMGHYLTSSEKALEAKNEYNKINSSFILHVLTQNNAQFKGQLLKYKKDLCKGKVSSSEKKEFCDK